MPRFYLITTLVGLFLSIQTPVSSQESSCLRRVLPLTVTDPQGTVIEGIRSSDFEAKYGGGPVKVLVIRGDDRPHRIVIVLDASESMALKWRAAVALASRFAESDVPSIKTALVVFRTKVEETVDFSPGQNAVAERLRQIRSEAFSSTPHKTGKTAVYDSLLTGLQLLETPTSADSLYLISDGEENVSHSDPREVVHRLTLSGVRLHVSLLVNEVHRERTPEERAGPDALSDIVKKTGGLIDMPFGPNVPQDPSAIERRIREMGGPLREFLQSYRLDLELPTPLKKPQTLTLKPSNESAASLKRAVITYPRELAACKD